MCVEPTKVSPHNLGFDPECPVCLALAAAHSCGSSAFAHSPSLILVLFANSMDANSSAEEKFAGEFGQQANFGESELTNERAASTLQEMANSGNNNEESKYDAYGQGYETASESIPFSIHTPPLSGFFARHSQQADQRRRWLRHEARAFQRATNKGRPMKFLC